jgi:Ca2+-binding RTX toxin-like protein
VNEIHVSGLRSTWANDLIEYIRFDDGFLTSLPDYGTWLTGTSGNDVSAGNGSDNTIIGFAGDDTITGAGGNDDAHGGAGEDSLDGGDGNDLLYGGDDDDILYGRPALTPCTAAAAPTRSCSRPRAPSATST